MSRFHYAARALVFSLALTLISGCALLQRVSFEAPSASLQGVAVTGLGLNGGTLELQLDVYNPNGYALRSTRMAVTIDLEQTPFGEALLERPLELPARARSTVTIPLAFTWSGVGAGARALLGKGSVDYRLAGRMTVDGPLGERGVTIGTSGNVGIRDLVR